MTSGSRIGGLLAFALVAASCDSPRRAGGSVETENVTALVVDVDSIAPVAARVGGLPIVATVRLDSTNFDFEHTGPNGEHLAVERLDGSPVPFTIHRWEAAGKWARVQIRIEGESLRRGSRIRLRTGSIRPSMSDSVTVWAWIPPDLVQRWTSVLVDDFEQGGLRTRLPVASSWYVKQADSGTISEPALVAADDGRSGSALRFDYDAPPPRAGYVLLGTTLSDRPVNFASLDSIVFWARGSGILSVSLDHQFPGGAVTKTWMHNDLDSNWTRWCVRPRDFDSPSSSAGLVGWDSVHDSVTTLSLFAAGRGTVWLDDIRFFGMHEDDFR
jgi:hypothetical protein